jgi:hypothetical protein
MKLSRYFYIIVLAALLTISIACDLSYETGSHAIDFFTVNTTNVAPNGSVTLSWKVTKADEVFIDNGIGKVTKEGTRIISIAESGSYTYTLTAVTSGKREIASVTISCQDSLAANTSKIIDHTCTNPSLIPAEALDLAKTRMLFQYSRYGAHGDQILIGLDELEAENPLFVSAYSECHFPSEYPALRLLNGFWAFPGLMPCISDISPEYYWQDIYGFYWFFFNILFGKHPNINASIWMWENDLDGYSHLLLTRYTLMLDEYNFLFIYFLPMFVGVNPIDFIFSTGPADTANAVRAERNQEIRTFCKKYNLWLLDIEDIESWYNGEQYFENGIPTRHPHYADDGSGGGTNADLRRAKAVAFWWLSARLAGWNGQ